MEGVRSIGGGGATVAYPNQTADKVKGADARPATMAIRPAARRPPLESTLEEAAALKFLRLLAQALPVIMG